MADINVPFSDTERGIILINLPGMSRESNILDDTSLREVTLTESILTPGLQTRVFTQDKIGSTPNRRNLDEYAGQPIFIRIERPILGDYGLEDTMEIYQTVYRLDNRKSQSRSIQNFGLQICDPSLLRDANSLVSRSWSCKPPHQVVADVLSQCVGVSSSKLKVEPAEPTRDYVAENIHPFQVCTQQADVALASGNDPSFLHFMTYEDLGTHHFKSLKKMAQQPPLFGGTKFRFTEPEASLGGYHNPFNIIKYEFPCDFDTLCDILNGVGNNGASQRSLQTFNPANGVWSNLGSNLGHCGIGGASALAATTNFGTAKQQDSCPTNVEKYALLRQARMMLLEPDKVALRMTVPWNPGLHAGKTINVEFLNRGDPSHIASVEQRDNYGSGKYLISSLTHMYKQGGFCVTELDCVAESVARGQV